MRFTVHQQLSRHCWRRILHQMSMLQLYHHQQICCIHCSDTRQELLENWYGQSLSKRHLSSNRSQSHMKWKDQNHHRSGSERLTFINHGHRHLLCSCLYLHFYPDIAEQNLDLQPAKEIIVTVGCNTVGTAGHEVISARLRISTKYRQHIGPGFNVIHDAVITAVIK